MKTAIMSECDEFTPFSLNLDIVTYELFQRRVSAENI